MYRIEAWSQGDGALWAPGSNGGAGVRPEDAAWEGESRAHEEEGDGDEASRYEGEASPHDFEESDLDWVASY